MSAGRRTPQAPGPLYNHLQPRKNAGRNSLRTGTVVQETLTLGQGQESRPLENSDLELVLRAARGDSAAFHALVDRHSAALFRLAQSLSRGRADAEDVVQETFFGAYRSLSTFDGRSSVKTWLKRILIRQAARVWHKSRESRTALPIESADLPTGRLAGDPDNSGHAARIDRKIDVGVVLRTLSPEYRQVLVLREFEQLSYAEIAEALGVPQGTVESRLHRARAELRGKLNGYRS